MKKHITLMAALIFTSQAALAANPSPLSAKKAVAIAKQKVGGGRVTDVDNKRDYYEIDIQRNKHSYEVRVDKRSKRATIVDIDHDND